MYNILLMPSGVKGENMSKEKHHRKEEKKPSLSIKEKRAKKKEKKQHKSTDYHLPMDRSLDE